MSKLFLQRAQANNYDIKFSVEKKSQTYKDVIKTALNFINSSWVKYIVFLQFFYCILNTGSN